MAGFNITEPRCKGGSNRDGNPNRLHGKVFDQDARISSADFVFGSALGRENFGGCFNKSALLLEIDEGLRGKGKELGKAALASQVLYERHQLSAQALIFRGTTDVKTSQLRHLFLGVRKQRDTANDVPVDLEHPVGF